jgi:integrase/recombinase XerD
VPGLPAASQAAIDRFIDALWIEDGLAPLTLAAYRRDLTLYAAWLPPRRQGRWTPAARSRPAGLHRRPPRRQPRHHGQPAADGVQALLPLGAARAPGGADPTLRLLAARQPLRVPKTLSEAQVEALLAAPDVDTPLGLRDRTMLELMYASGLRVSELVA